MHLNKRHKKSLPEMNSARGPAQSGFLKLVYTWDYRMRWAPVRRPVERGMGGRPYEYGSETFLSDYTKACAWFARQGYDGIAIWGLLRDSHGGVDTAKKLCRRASEEGIHIIATVGVNSYGGVFYEGNNPYSLENRVKEHPELAAIDQHGKPMIKGHQNNMIGNSMLCPSKPENFEWYLKCLEWLVSELPIGGILYEMGDYGVCYCEKCLQRLGRSKPYSYADANDIVPGLMEHAHKLRPGILQLIVSMEQFLIILALI